MSDYPPSAHAADRARLKRIRDVAEETLEVFFASFSPEQWWPYEIEGGEPRYPGREVSRSSSTGAMIAHALATSVGRIRQSRVIPSVHTWKPVEAPEVKKGEPGLDDHITMVMDGLVKQVVDVAGDDAIVTSPTWGANNPLTLLWLHELLVARQSEVDAGSDDAVLVGQALIKLQAAAGGVVKRVLEHPSVPVLDLGANGPRPVPHVFPVLRALQLRRVMKGQGSTDEVVGWLEQQLHHHLSQAEIRDGEFDAAQLIFALEGLLTVRVDAVTSSVIARVNDVLRQDRTTNPHWRPVRPLTINAQGQILLPQSVEVASSLLRVRNLLDGREQVDPDLELLNDYCEWILAARRTVPAPGKADVADGACSGWQSEHTHAQGLVHLWVTSQVLLFLQHHGAALQQHMARMTRATVGVTLSSPTRKKADPAEEWTRLSEQEPLLGLPGTHTLAYATVAKEFIQPRLRGGVGANAFCSMLLYGPPGTGKSSFVENLAATLGYGFLTITPSDFIRSGEADVEARAQSLFEMLDEQSDVVVLFDEIDRLILGRGRDDYGQQSDMFQFMTPSMLTKLNDLRKPGRVVFVIATNYVERIDSAIKRSGRIDRQLLLLPPALAQRCKIIEKLYDDRFDAPLSAPTEVERLARLTPLFSYSELKVLFERAVLAQGEERQGGALVAQMIERAADFTPAIDLPSYLKRFELEEQGDGQKGEKVWRDVDTGPADELRALVAIVEEVSGTPFTDSPDLIALHQACEAKEQEDRRRARSGPASG